MKKRIVFILTVLCILLTACAPPPVYIRFRLEHVPENAEVFFLLPDADGETYRQFDREKDGRIVLTPSPYDAKNGLPWMFYLLMMYIAYHVDKRKKKKEMQK